MIDLCSSSEDSNSDRETIDSSNEQSEGGDSDSAGSLIDFIDDSACKKKRANTKVDKKMTMLVVRCIVLRKSVGKSLSFLAVMTIVIKKMIKTVCFPYPLGTHLHSFFILCGLPMFTCLYMIVK